jgi:transcriptional regulator with XRE-family HTH domain
MSSAEVRAFGREVHRRRVALGMSLDTLGLEAGLTPNYLSSIERGERPRGVSLDAAFKLAKALDAELSDLLGARSLSAAEIEVGRLVHAMPTEVKVLMINLLRALAAWKRKAR